MKSLRAKAAIVLAAMLLALAGAHAWRPTQRLADTRPKVNLETLFPRSFGDWTVDAHMPVQLISPDTQAVLDKIYNQTLSRTYVNRQGERIMLSVAYGGDQSDATRAHRPEVCYPAQGFQILSGRDGAIDLGGQKLRVRHLLSRLGGRVEPISYWIMVGNRVTLSGTEQKLAQLSYSTRGVVPDGMLVRVSSISGDEAMAYEMHQRFVAQLSLALTGGLRSQVFGLSGA